MGFNRTQDGKGGKSSHHVVSNWNQSEIISPFFCYGFFQLATNRTFLCDIFWSRDGALPQPTAADCLLGNNARRQVSPGSERSSELVFNFIRSARIGGAKIQHLCSTVWIIWTTKKRKNFLLSEPAEAFCCDPVWGSQLLETLVSISIPSAFRYALCILTLIFANAV